MPIRGVIFIAMMLLAVATIWRKEIFAWLTKNFSDFKDDDTKGE